jgi:hypothetical protein
MINIFIFIQIRYLYKYVKISPRRPSHPLGRDGGEIDFGGEKGGGGGGDMSRVINFPQLPPSLSNPVFHTSICPLS